MTAEQHVNENEEAAPGARPAPVEDISLAAWRRRRKPLSRRAKIWVTFGVLAFLVVSGLLARWLQTENEERDADVALLEAQARGNVQGMLNRLQGCSATPSCVATVRANAKNPRLLRSGAIKILQLESSTAYSLTGATGKSRVAWTVIGKLPVVQCVMVRRTGNFVSGIDVHLVSLSAPIPNEAEC